MSNKAYTAIFAACTALVTLIYLVQETYLFQFFFPEKWSERVLMAAIFLLVIARSLLAVWKIAPRLSLKEAQYEDVLDAMTKTIFVAGWAQALGFAILRGKAMFPEIEFYWSMGGLLVASIAAGVMVLKRLAERRANPQ